MNVESEEVKTSSTQTVVRREAPLFAGVIWTLFTIGNIIPTTTSASYAKELPPVQTDAGGNLQSHVTAVINTATSLSEIRRLSGLTWEELGELFSVSRRSIHNWASGEAVAAKHEKKVLEVLGALRQLDCGEAALTRRFLLAPTAAGRSIFELLREGALAEALANSPAAQKHASQRVPLSAAEQHRRTPSSVSTYLEATDGPPAKTGNKLRATGRPRGRPV